MSAWCGIRPLVIDPNAKNTQSIARNHVIEVMDNKLVTIGGKYSEMDMGLNCLQFKSAVTSIHILLVVYQNLHINFNLAKDITCANEMYQNTQKKPFLQSPTIGTDYIVTGHH